LERKGEREKDKGAFEGRPGEGGAADGTPRGGREGGSLPVLWKKRGREERALLFCEQFQSKKKKKRRRGGEN